jgi:hypothetical protein
VPNVILDNHLDQVADALAVVARINFDEIKNKKIGLFSSIVQWFTK